MARGLAAGAFWGVPLGAVTLPVVFAVPPAQALAAAGLGAMFGAVIGGLVGLISGLVLAVAEQPDADGPAPRTDRSRRRTAFLSSAAPFLVPALLTLPVPQLLLFWLPVALISGTAGACLAPCVVRGRTREGA